jgi:hypothetical protein
LTVLLFPGFGPEYSAIAGSAKTGLTVTLFLIGAGLSRDVIRSVGLKPVIQGVALWTLISSASLFVIAR